MENDLDRQLEDRLTEARRLAHAGSDTEARSAYLSLLQIDPTHFAALTELAALALSTGYREAATTAYRQAAASHPDNPIGLVNLANVLLEEETLPEARELYERALALNPDLHYAHQGLGNVFARLGDEAMSQYHRDLGFTSRNIVVRPYRGNEKPIRVLLIVSVKGGNIPTNLILDDHQFSVTAIYAEYHEQDKPLPDHDIIFNAVGDEDLCERALDGANAIVARSSAPTINRPEFIRGTGRAANAARLSRCDDMTVPTTKLFVKSALEDSRVAASLAAGGFAFPLLLRSPGYHTGQNFVVVPKRADIPAALAGLPGEEILVIQFMDLRGPDGLFRKYRVMFIDGKLYPLHLALAHDWKVHYFSSAMAENADFRAEEARFLTDMTGILGARAMHALENIRNTLSLDYGGADFGLDHEGKLVLFEANATMAIVPPGPQPIWDYRRNAVDRALAATQDMIRMRAAARSDAVR